MRVQNEIEVSRLVDQRRFLLWIGLSGLLGIFALTGFSCFLTVRQIRHREESRSRQLLAWDRFLNEIRSSVYLSEAHICNYLLDPAPDASVALVAHLGSDQQAMEKAMDFQRHQGHPSVAKEFTDVQVELSQLSSVVRPILRWMPSERRERGFRFLNDEVFPRGTAILNIVNRIAVMNERQLDGGSKENTTFLSSIENPVLLTFLVTLSMDVLVAMMLLHRILRLERRSLQKYFEVVADHSRLAAFSAELIDMQENERSAIARELHDDVGQPLSAALIELRNVIDGVSSGEVRAARAASAVIRELAQDALKTVRNISLRLRPSILDDLGLIAAIEWQAREASNLSGINVSVDGDTEPAELPENLKTAVYRIIQEALRDTTLHAGATEVRVSVSLMDRHLVVTIRDNGRGFDPVAAGKTSLLGIEERALQLDGTLSVVSEPARGTAIALDFPIADLS